jgi:hypothetical protein
MKRRKCSIFSMVLLMTLIVGSLPAYVRASDEKKIPKLGPVKLNAHPTSLEGKTVLLRWNGKYNGDKFLIRVGELLTQQVKNVKILKMWEKDPGTAVMSKSEEVSKQITAKIERLKPDIVIAAQAD